MYPLLKQQRLIADAARTLRLHHKKGKVAQLKRLLFYADFSLESPLLYTPALGRFSLSTESRHKGVAASTRSS